MGKTHIFLRKVKQTFCTKCVLGIFLVFLLCLSSCGEEDGGVGERLSGPETNSVLPMRIDATVIPTTTVLPQTGQENQDHQELSATETDPNTPLPNISVSPLPDGISTTDPSIYLSDETLQTPIEVSPTPSAVPTPEEVRPATSSILESVQSVVTSENITVESQSKQDPESAEETQLSESDEDEQQESETPTETPTDTSESSIAIVTPYGITLDQVIVCSQISDRNPSGSRETFSIAKIKKVYTWVRVSGVKPPKRIKHLYYWEGKLVARVELELEYSSMRTWSQKTLKPLEALGKWQVIITTENEDEVLAVKEFTVVP
jgi:hypothetical protein